MKVGLVGAGAVANKFHLPTWRKLGVPVQIISDLNLKSARFAARRFKIPAVCYDLEDVLRTGVDIVDICTPVQTHYDIAKRCLAAGKHVLIEKPLTADSAQAIELADIAKKKKLALFVNQNHIFSSAVTGLKKLIEEEFGELLFLSVDWWISTFKSGHWTANPSSGGLLFEMGAHPYYISRFLFGPASSIHSFGNCPSKERKVGYVNSILKNGNGAVCSIQMTPHIQQPTVKAFGKKSSAFVHLFSDTLISKKKKMEDAYLEISMRPLFNIGVSSFLDWMKYSTKIGVNYAKRGFKYVLEKHSALNQYKVFKYAENVVNGLQMNHSPEYYMDIAVDCVSWLEKTRKILNREGDACAG